MKYLKTFFVPAAASLVFLAASCAKEQFAGSADTLADSEYTAVTLTAGFDTSVRTAVDAEGKVSWKAGDIIRYYSESGGAVGSATVGQDCAVAVFEATVPQNASFLVAACVGESATLPERFSPLKALSAPGSPDGSQMPMSLSQGLKTLRPEC